MKLLIKGLVWTDEFVLCNDMPSNVLIEVNEDCFNYAKDNNYLGDYLKNEIAEDFVFTPIRIKTYRILK